MRLLIELIQPIAQQFHRVGNCPLPGADLPDQGPGFRANFCQIVRFAGAQADPVHAMPLQKSQQLFPCGKPQEFTPRVQAGSGNAERAKRPQLDSVTGATIASPAASFASSKGPILSMFKIPVFFPSRNIARLEKRYPVSCDMNRIIETRKP
jgi:hypothetical protein